MLADGLVVGRIMKAAAVPVGQSWMWTLAYGHHEDRTPTHGYEPTREARWRRLRGGRHSSSAAMSGIGGNPKIICSFWFYRF
jgi:hypothetical protein